MTDTIRKLRNYSDREISDRLELAAEKRKHIKKHVTPEWIAEILKEYLPVKIVDNERH